MKSAFELAMERMGGPVRSLSEEQKKKIAEIDSIYRAKIAERKLRFEDEMKKSQSDPETSSKLRSQIQCEIRELEEKCEKQKDAVRSEKS